MAHDRFRLPSVEPEWLDENHSQAVCFVAGRTYVLLREDIGVWALYRAVFDGQDYVRQEAPLYRISSYDETVSALRSALKWLSDNRFGAAKVRM